MYKMYVGESINVSARIKRRHCTGNVKVSAFRLTVAQAMGFPIAIIPTLSKNGNKYNKVYINIPQRKAAEKQVSQYISHGKWKFVQCHSKEEARDFQNFAINKLKPVLNRHRPNWKVVEEIRYVHLLSELLNCEWSTYDNKNFPKGPGVYLHGNIRSL